MGGSTRFFWKLFAISIGTSFLLVPGFIGVLVLEERLTECACAGEIAMPIVPDNRFRKKYPLFKILHAFCNREY